MTCQDSHAILQESLVVGHGYIISIYGSVYCTVCIYLYIPRNSYCRSKVEHNVHSKNGYEMNDSSSLDISYILIHTYLDLSY